MSAADGVPAVYLVVDNAAPSPRDPEDDGHGGGPGGPPPHDGGPEAQPVWCSDDDLAAALSAAAGADWRCIQPTVEWHHWTGCVWLADVKKRIIHLSRQVCRRKARAIEKDFGLARKVSSRERIYAAVALAAADPRHATPLEAFDADIWKLNTPGGILDLRTGQLHAHDREALMSKIAAAGPEGECPRFRQFLRELTGNDIDLEKYLQRVAGYCATGSVQEEVFFFLWGHSNTGKSKFQEILAYMLGDYATSAPMDTFIVATGERHPTELAAFRGRRLVIAAETQEGRRFDEAKLKAITGGDLITARFMRGDFFTFKPQFKLLLAGNHRPRLRSADDAMRRRVQMVPLDHKPPKIDKLLMGKLKAETGGIAKWIAEGAVEWQRMGLAPPAAVVKTTDEYFENENTIGRWIDERCDKGANLYALTRVLYTNFKSWATACGEFVPAERVFSQRLQQVSGLARCLIGSRERKAGYRGIALLGSSQEEMPFDQRDPARGSGGVVVEARETPGEPVSDPADEYDR